MQFANGDWGLVFADASNPANLLFARGTGSPAPDQWQSPVTIATGGADAPALVRVGASTLAVFYRAVVGSVEQVMLRTSADGGATWSSATQLSTETTNVYQIQATQDGSTVYVFWSLNLTAGTGVLRYRTSTTLSTWSTTTTVGQTIGISTGSYAVPTFDVKKLSSGRWWLVWTAADSGGGDPALPVVWVATSADLATWAAATKLTASYGDRWPTGVSLAQTPSGTLYVAFADYAYPWDQYIFVRTTADGGVTWTPKTVYGYDPALGAGGWTTVQAADPKLLVDATGAVHLLWDQGFQNGYVPLLYRRLLAPSLGPITQLLVGLPSEAAAPAASFTWDMPAANAQSADPVQTLSGTYTYTHTDLAIAGRGPTPTIARAYHSTETRTTPLGPGWTFNYAAHLGSAGDGSGTLILVSPDGGSNRYTPAGPATYNPPPGLTTSLVHNPNGTYTATLANQTTWLFNSPGQLIAVADRYGNTSLLNYNSHNQLVGVTDPAGRGSLTLAYDTCFSGRLCSVTDWSNRVVTYGYDSQGRLQTVTDRTNQPTTFAYDGTSVHLTTITHANSNVAVTNHYDSQGRVDWQKDAQGLVSGQKTTFAYGTPDGQGNVTTTVTYPTTSFDGFATTVADTFDAHQRLVKRVSAPSATESYTETYGYDANWFRNSVTDARSHATTACYDVGYTGALVAGSRGNVTRLIAPPPTGGATPPVTLFKYDSKNNLVETIAPKGVNNSIGVSCTTNLSGSLTTTYATDTTYDSAGVQLLAIARTYTDPDLGRQTATTKFEYGDSQNPGRVTRVIPPRGNTGATPDYTYATTLAYNGSGNQAGMLQSATDPLANTTTYTYDAVGRQTSLVDPDGNAPGATGDHTWTTAYDNEDRPTSIQGPAPSGSGAKLTTTLHYDLVGNRDWAQDANGQYTRSSYDVRDSLQEVDQSATMADPASDPSKIVTQYTYDNLGNLQRVLRAAGNSANERATDYAYDGSNRIRKEIQYPSWPSTSATLLTQYRYDGVGNRTALVDPLSQTTTFGYDALNRRAGITYSDGQTPNVTYGYDSDNNRSSMADGTGQTTYSYDELDRPTSITSPGAKTVGYRYDLDGNRTRVLYPDSTAVTYVFNKGSQLASLADWANRSTSYSYLPDGHLKQASNVNGTTTGYTYDNAQRLGQVLNQHGTSTLSQHTYTLDNASNRTQVAEVLAQVGGGTLTPSTTYSHDKLYRLLGDGTNSYSYDPVGNRLTWGTTSYSYDRADRITAAGATVYTVNANGDLVTRGADSFSYDQANRLKTATLAGTASSYVYDGDGKRSSATSGGHMTSFVYDVVAGLPVVLLDASRKYVWGAGGLAYETDLTGNV